jgi:hypothetical protein
MHIQWGDTWQVGLGWLNEADYGEGGFFIMIGFMYINFWRKPQWVKDIEDSRNDGA